MRFRGMGNVPGLKNSSSELLLTQSGLATVNVFLTDHRNTKARIACPYQINTLSDVSVLTTRAYPESMPS